jgi:hypothetical protein
MGEESALAMILLPAMLLTLLTDGLRSHNDDGRHDEVLKQADKYLKPATPDVMSGGI